MTTLLELPASLLVEVVSTLDVDSTEQSRVVCRQVSAAASADAVWELLALQQWRGKKKHAVDRFNMPSSSFSSSSSSWRERYVAAEVDSRRDKLSGAKELSCLRFDFRFRSEPKLVHTKEFRFGRDGKVYGHPNRDLHYRWEIVREGQGVRLGPFPIARVRRTKTWGWALCNPNIVCVSVDGDEGHVDREGAEGGKARTGADGEDDSYIEDEELIRANPEIFAEYSWRDGSGSKEVDDGPLGELGGGAGASRDGEGEGGAGEGGRVVRVRLPDGSLVMLPERLWQILQLQQEVLNSTSGDVDVGGGDEDAGNEDESESNGAAAPAAGEVDGSSELSR
jgi:hypothetical protein